MDLVEKNVTKESKVMKGQLLRMTRIIMKKMKMQKLKKCKLVMFKPDTDLYVFFAVKKHLRNVPQWLITQEKELNQMMRSWSLF